MRKVSKAIAKNCALLVAKSSMVLGWKTRCDLFENVHLVISRSRKEPSTTCFWSARKMLDTSVASSRVNVDDSVLGIDNAQRVYLIRHALANSGACRFSSMAVSALRVAL